MPKKSEVTIIRDYLKERHNELYGIDYVTRNYAMEGRLLKSMINQYGTDVAKRFIDSCFSDYKPTQKYPGLSFNFMYSYMRERVLPRVLAEIKREEKAQQYEKKTAISDDEIENWL